MRLSPTPIYHGIRLSYYRLSKYKLNRLIQSTHKVVGVALPTLCLSLTVMSAWADDNAISQPNRVIDGIIFNDPVLSQTTLNNVDSVDNEINTIALNSDNDIDNNHSGTIGSTPISDNESINPQATDQNKLNSGDNHSSAELHQTLNNDKVQNSLERLAEFYEPNQPDSSSNSTNLPNDVLDSLTSVPTVNADSIAPVVAPSLYHRSPSAPRCEGVWVSPNNRSNYQDAIERSRSMSDFGNKSDKFVDVDNSIDNSQMPFYSESNYGYYDSTTYVELSGDVKVVQGSQLIEAEQLVLDLQTGIAGANGDVMFTDAATNTNNTQAIQSSGLIGVSGALAYDTKSGQSTAYDVAFASLPLQAHGYAQRLNKPSENIIEMDKVMFSTCPPDNRKWQLEAQQIDLDTKTGRGEAYDTTFRLQGVPIFYLPYFNFPIDTRRASGFLMPSASIDSESGIRLTIPYYFNLAPNYDATLTTDIFTNRNPMLTGDFRYLTDYGSGDLIATYLPNDSEYDDEDRRGVFYRHRWQSDSIEHLSAEAVYSYVSDPDYSNDFDRLGVSDNDINLPRRAQVNYYNDYLTGQFKVETFQSLDAKDSDGNPILDKDKPYSRLPQLSLQYKLPWIDAFDIRGVHDSAYFKKSITDDSENEKSGLRIYNELSASFPMRRAWGYITPKVKLQHLYTAYDETSRLDNNISEEDSSQSVLVPQFSVDAGLNFYQAGSPLNLFDDTMGGYQLLTPRVKYRYSPYRSQNDIPNFNTRIASINYEQLYEDSWLLGYDRISDNHSITPGINYRYIDAMGVTRFDASIAEQFFVDEGQVILDEGNPILTQDSSGIVWNTSAQPYRNLWLDFSGALGSDYDINFLAGQLRYHPTSGSLINLGYIKRTADDNANQLPLTAWTASTLFPVNENWRVLAQGQYDYKRDKMIDALVGVDYEDCCYGFAIYGRRYYNDLNISEDPTEAIMFEFRINGLGGDRSSRLTRLLNQKVSGFETVDEAWRF